MARKLMPDLPIYSAIAISPMLGIDLERVPVVANELAAVLEKEDTDMRTSLAAICHVLGWLAVQVQRHGTNEEEFLEAIRQQVRNYCIAFSQLPAERRDDLAIGQVWQLSNLDQACV